MFDRGLNVLQTGCTITRVIPAVRGPGPCKLTRILYPVGVGPSPIDRVFINDPVGQVRPHLDLTFDNILAHINTVYVLNTKPGITNGDSGDGSTISLRLKVNDGSADSRSSSLLLLLLLLTLSIMRRRLFIQK